MISICYQDECFMSIEVEMRTECDNFDEARKILEACDCKPVKQLYGVDYYIDGEKSKKTGRWIRVRDHSIQENGKIISYQISQTKRYVTSLPNKYLIECWDESYPKPVRDITQILRGLENQGHSILEVEVYRCSYHVPFKGKSIEVDNDILFRRENHLFLPAVFCIEFGIVIAEQDNIEQATNFVDEFMSYAESCARFDVRPAPIYPIILLNRRSILRPMSLYFH